MLDYDINLAWSGFTTSDSYEGAVNNYDRLSVTTRVFLLTGMVCHQG